MRMVSAPVQAAANSGIAALLISLFVCQGLFFIRANSPTYDEAMHLAAGYSYLATKNFRLEPQNPPLIKMYLAAPLFFVYRLPFDPDPQQWRDRDDFLVGQEFLYRSPLDAEKMLFVSRVFNLLLGVCLLALIGWWSYRLWGMRAALLCLALASLEPNLVAHSSLVTGDVGSTLLIVASVYLLWEYLSLPQWRILLGTAAAIGMAFNAKFSSLILIPTLAAIVATSAHFGSGFRLPRTPPYRPPDNKVIESGLVLLILFFFALLTIPAAYFFQGFQWWFSGLIQFSKLARSGQAAFFLGEYSYDGWWSYFFIAFLIKTPIGTLILLAASLILHRAGRRLCARDAIFLFVPVAMVFVLTSQAKVNIGLRHILPVYPFLFILASRLATVRRLWATTFIIGALALTAVSALRIAPHQLAYFNELIGGPDQGHCYLGDSNIDWGQDLKALKSYMDKEKLPIIYLSYFGTAPPSYYKIRHQYVPGAWPLEWPPSAEKVPTDAPRKILAISVNNLQDLGMPHNPLFRWLWNRRPVAKIGYSIFIYDFTDDAEALAKLRETYFKAGLAAP